MDSRDDSGEPFSSAVEASLNFVADCQPRVQSFAARAKRKTTKIINGLS
jgi:hypothetical protein